MSVGGKSSAATNEPSACSTKAPPAVGSVAGLTGASVAATKEPSACSTKAPPAVGSFIVVAVVATVG